MLIVHAKISSDYDDNSNSGKRKKRAAIFFLIFFDNKVKMTELYTQLQFRRCRNEMRGSDDDMQDTDRHCKPVCAIDCVAMFML